MGVLRPQGQSSRLHGEDCISPATPRKEFPAVDQAACACMRAQVWSQFQLKIKKLDSQRSVWEESVWGSSQAERGDSEAAWASQARGGPSRS